MSNNNVPYLYILCRNDLNSMNHGKAISHGVHAGNKFTYHMENHDTEKNSEYLNWLSQANGFGTTISLSVSLPEMLTIISSVNAIGLVAAEVVDPTYPYIIHREYAELINHSAMVSTDTLHRLEREGVVGNSPKSLGNGMMRCLRSEITSGYVFGTYGELKPILGEFPMVP